MVRVDCDLFPDNVVGKVIRRLDNLVVGGHTAFVGPARLSDLHHRIVCSGIGGSRNIYHPAEAVLVDSRRKR